MTKTSEFTWDKEAARALLTEFENFWSQTPEKYGITAKPRADTQLKTSRSLFGLMRGHGKRGRKQDLFYGAGDIWEDLVEISQDNLILDDELAEFKFFLRALDKIEDSDRDPRNIVFNTVVSFDEKSGDAERGEVRGHFLTQAYWNFRKNKAEKTDDNYDVAKPDPEWVSLQGEKNKAKPPLWAIIFGKTNSLRTLIQDIEKLAREPINPPLAHLDLKISSGKVGQLASVPSIQAAVRNVLSRADIYKVGKETAPVKGRLNDAMAEQSISVSEEIMNLIAPEATVLVENDGRIIRRKLTEFPDYKGIKSVTLNFPRNNIVLNRLIREVMGDDIKTFEKPNRPEDGPFGLTLKADEAELIREASSILKEYRFTFEGKGENPPVMGVVTRRDDEDPDVNVRLGAILTSVADSDDMEYLTNIASRRFGGANFVVDDEPFDFDQALIDQVVETLSHESTHYAQNLSPEFKAARDELRLQHGIIAEAIIELMVALGTEQEQELRNALGEIIEEVLRTEIVQYVNVEFPAYYSEPNADFNSAVERVRNGWLYANPFISKLTETVNYIATISGRPPVYSREDLQRMGTRSVVAFNNFIDEFARRGQNNEA